MEGEEEVNAFDAKNRLSALIDEVAQGKRIWITRRGKRVALLSSGLAHGKKANLRLLDDFRKIRAKAKPGRESLKALVEEGRR